MHLCETKTEQVLGELCTLGAAEGQPGAGPASGCGQGQHQLSLEGEAWPHPPSRSSRTLHPGSSGSGGTSRLELILASPAEEGAREPAEKHWSLVLPPAVSPDRAQSRLSG